MERLRNKIAIVTGAAGGMGAAEAHLFAQHGARVIATDIQCAKLKAWVTEAKKDGLLIEDIKHDVTSEADWNKVVDMTLAIYGRIDILINNAGIFPGFFDCEQTSKELWDKVIAINLTGPFLGCKACIPQMKKTGGGSIVNIGSIAGLVGGNGVAYSASKGGLSLLTKDLAVTFAKDKIRVNNICPGGVLTPMTEDLLKQPGMEEMIKNLSPQGRVADPIEIAWGALFLASDESSFLTGADIPIDGGAVAR
ncbi:glucose 1-dehydrogenase [Ferruginibacter lapsinanis]|uniref:SDR family NAD(P)-dependent oxidoreductase n=1 Tax=Ferruginibacter lapsinanis TaxID=563172 RepID=UPI001E2BD617|nr:glucose 1-dehydrogenase [Ferruginibacter lapsinanis]UEG50793.1 glucose 1-dehydrogenase [Ferruginibacter lapsinanis]